MPPPAPTPELARSIWGLTQSGVLLFSNAPTASWCYGSPRSERSHSNMPRDEGGHRQRGSGSTVPERSQSQGRLGPAQPGIPRRVRGNEEGTPTRMPANGWNPDTGWRRAAPSRPRRRRGASLALGSTTHYTHTLPTCRRINGYMFMCRKPTLLRSALAALPWRLTSIMAESVEALCLSVSGTGRTAGTWQRAPLRQ